MQGIQEDGYESAEEEFHLTTSGEFCDGASRTRAMPMEELELEELKLWDQEELELSRAQGGAVLAPPAVEVAALLRHVPPSLRRRYCARLRAEAQRRRAATRTWSRLSDGRSKSTRTWSITTLSPWSIVFLTAALWNSVNGMAWMGGMGSTGKITDIERAWPDRLMNDANVSNQSASIDSFRLIGSGCPDALKKAEDEAISLEVITRRDIMGYNQMLASIHDWTTTLTTRVQRPIARCLKMEGPRFLNLVQDLRSSLLAAHARAARARAQVTMERNARIFLSEA